MSRGALRPRGGGHKAGGNGETSLILSIEFKRKINIYFLVAYVHLYNVVKLCKIISKSIEGCACLAN